MLIREDGNKAYFDSPFDMKHFSADTETCRVVGVGREVIAFGKVLIGGGEQFIHFRRQDWEDIKKFIDKQIKG